MDAVRLHVYTPRVAIICDGEQVGIGVLKIRVLPGEGIVDETLVDTRVKCDLPNPEEHTYELQFFDMCEAVAWQSAKTPEQIGKDM